MTFIFPVEISSTEQCHEGCKKNNIAFFTLLLYLCVSTSNQKHNKGIESSIDSNNFYIPFQFSLKKTVSEYLKHKIIIKSLLVNWHIFSTWTALYTVVAVDLPQASLFWGQILARFLLLACWLYRSALNLPETRKLCSFQTIPLGRTAYRIQTA